MRAVEYALTTILAVAVAAGVVWAASAAAHAMNDAANTIANASHGQR